MDEDQGRPPGTGGQHPVEPGELRRADHAPGHACDRTVEPDQPHRKVIDQAGGEIGRVDIGHHIPKGGAHLVGTIVIAGYGVPGRPDPVAQRPEHGILGGGPRVGEVAREDDGVDLGHEGIDVVHGRRQQAGSIDPAIGRPAAGLQMGVGQLGDQHGGSGSKADAGGGGHVDAEQGTGLGQIGAGGGFDHPAFACGA